MGSGMYTNYKTIAELFTTSGKIGGGRPKFYNFPRQVVWDSIKDFHIFQGVPLVRESQYTRGSIGGLSEDTHHVFLQSAPYLKRGSQKVSGDKWITKSCFYAGVQMTPNEDGVMEANPDENPRMTLRSGQRDPRVGKPMSEDRADIWKRRVICRSKEWFAIT